jgi:hypothetical protein
MNKNRSKTKKDEGSKCCSYYILQVDEILPYSNENMYKTIPM